MKNLRPLIYAILLIFCVSKTWAQSTDTRTLSSEPKEIYGNVESKFQIRIGNGGAGPTGILRALAEDYLKFSGKNYSIAWYQDISVNTLTQLKNGKIDIALVYEKSQGDAAQKEGWAKNYTPIFNDHFLIVGPKNNAAKLLKSDSAENAFSKIARLGHKNSIKTFLSRDDNSGTNVKEKSIWNSLNLEPWQEQNSWYFKHHVFPKDALLYADKNSLYTLTDWGTWRANKSELQNLKIYVRGGQTLLNPCFALTGANPNTEVLEFLEYLKNNRGQKLIANFGKKSETDSAFFTPAKIADF